MVSSLDRLIDAITSREDGFVVGWRDGEALGQTAFVQRMAAWRSMLRDTPGQQFALYIDDSIEFSAALLGAWLAGKTVWLTADTLPATCASLRPSVDGFLGEFAAQWAPLMPAADAAFGLDLSPLQNREEDFIALIVHTSGTTGAAQAIPKRLSQLTSEVATLEVLFGAQIGNAAIVATVSHQHIYGLLFKVLWPLAAGRAIHARILNFPEELMRALEQQRCALVASPAYLKRVPDHLAWSQVSAQLAAVFSSGGPLPAETAQAVGSLLNRRPIEVYGSSETGGIAWRQRAAATDDAWQALPGVACRVADDGALEVCSPHLADSNWLRLADRAALNSHGRFQLQGRSDRIAKIEEKRISLDAIENFLRASKLVDEARVIVADDALVQRQRIAAFVVPSAQGRAVLTAEGKLALNRRLRDALVGAVEPVALPRRWRYLDSLPLNAQGKTTHALLMAALDERPRTPQLRELSRKEGRVELELSVPRDLFYFGGHFPQAPILPGVVQVDWAIAKGREYFPLPPHFCGMHALKFQQVIQPEQLVTLELIHDVEKGSLNFRYFSPNAQHASGRILFKDDMHA
jgi:acyl-CoA synthetase (AMP-forming)/AMP-acid ligase II